MNFLFDAETPVIDFDPLIPAEHEPIKRRQEICWPVLAHRVAAPRPRHHDLDLFERSVLALVGTGMESAGAMAELLDLHENLVTHVMARLRGRGLLKPTGRISDLGRTSLEEGRAEDVEILAGFVFQDPWDGSLWPAFRQILPENTTERLFDGPGDWPRIDLGGRGNRRPIRPHFVLPRGKVEAPPRPTTRDVVKALARLSRREGTDAGSPKLSDGGVTFLDDRPRPLFLHGTIYVPEGLVFQGDWFVSGLFGGDPDPELRRRLDDLVRNDEPLLAKRISGCQERDETEQEELRARVRRLEEEAERHVDGLFPRRIDAPPLRKELVRLYLALADHRILGRRDADRDVFAACRRCLEALFLDLKQRQPPEERMWKRLFLPGPRRPRPLPRDRVEEKIREAARFCGVDDHQLPERLRKVKAEQIRSVMAYDDAWRLRPAVVATLLVARERPDHPLRGALLRMPDLLHRVDELAHLGGAGSHAQEGASPGPEERTIDRAEETTWAVVRAIYDLPVTETAKEASRGEG